MFMFSLSKIVHWKMTNIDEFNCIFHKMKCIPYVDIVKKMINRILIIFIRVLFQYRVDIPCF